MTCELPEASTRLTPTANREHDCCECRRGIKVGDKYFRFSGIWSGIPATYKTCMRCVALRDLAIKKYSPVFEEDLPAFGLLRDWIRESMR